MAENAVTELERAVQRLIRELVEILELSEEDRKRLAYAYYFGDD